MRKTALTTPPDELAQMAREADARFGDITKGIRFQRDLLATTVEVTEG